MVIVRCSCVMCCSWYRVYNYLDICDPYTSRKGRNIFKPISKIQQIIGVINKMIGNGLDSFSVLSNISDSFLIYCIIFTFLKQVNGKAIRKVLLMPPEILTIDTSSYVSTYIIN